MSYTIGPEAAGSVSRLRRSSWLEFVDTDNPLSPDEMRLFEEACVSANMFPQEVAGMVMKGECGIYRIMGKAFGLVALSLRKGPLYSFLRVEFIAGEKVFPGQIHCLFEDVKELAVKFNVPFIVSTCGEPRLERFYERMLPEEFRRTEYLVKVGDRQ